MITKPSRILWPPPLRSALRSCFPIPHSNTRNPLIFADVQPRIQTQASSKERILKDPPICTRITYCGAVVDYIGRSCRPLRIVGYMRREVFSRSRLDSVTDWEARAKRAGYRVSALAKHCGVSERHLQRVLRLKFGKSPRAWLAERCLARAAASLQQTMLVKEVAAEAGFKSPAHFTRKFTRQYGISPSAFRLANAA